MRWLCARLRTWKRVLPTWKKGLNEMSSLNGLNGRLARLEERAPRSSDSTPCLVPPPHMELFTEREQAQLLELERKVIPFIPTGPGSMIQELGGSYLALFAIGMDVYTALEQMGGLSDVLEVLPSHERWILPRWWTVYKGLISPGSPEMEALFRRHIFRTREELLEPLLSIDYDADRWEYPNAHYPFTPIGYRLMNEQLEHGKYSDSDWYTLELWWDFAEKHQL